MSSDNPAGAANQQERPGFEQWVVGFVDGEGCFSVPIFRNHSCRLGWQVQPDFSVVQGARSVHVLHELERFFECGHVGRNARHDDHREDLYRYSVRSLGDLIGTIVPFFEAHPLRSAKRDEFRPLCGSRTTDEPKGSPHGGRAHPDRTGRADDELPSEPKPQ